MEIFKLAMPKLLMNHLIITTITIYRMPLCNQTMTKMKKKINTIMKFNFKVIHYHILTHNTSYKTIINIIIKNKNWN